MSNSYFLAETAYNAYCAATGGKSLISGERLPPFKSLREDIQNAWKAAADAVIVDALILLHTGLEQHED